MATALTPDDRNALEARIQASDRTGYYIKYYETTGSQIALLMAFISSFSGLQGETAEIANLMVKNLVGEDNYFPDGVIEASKSIAEAHFQAVNDSIAEGNSGVLSPLEELEVAKSMWNENGLGQLFPGNLSLAWEQLKEGEVIASLLNFYSLGTGVGILAAASSPFLNYGTDAGNYEDARYEHRTTADGKIEYIYDSQENRTIYVTMVENIYDILDWKVGINSQETREAASDDGDNYAAVESGQVESSVATEEIALTRAWIEGLREGIAFTLNDQPQQALNAFDQANAVYDHFKDSPQDFTPYAASGTMSDKSVFDIVEQGGISWESSAPSTPADWYASYMDHAEATASEINWAADWGTYWSSQNDSNLPLDASNGWTTGSAGGDKESDSGWGSGGNDGSNGPPPPSWNDFSPSPDLWGPQDGGGSGGWGNDNTGGNDGWGSGWGNSGNDGESESGSSGWGFGSDWGNSDATGSGDRGWGWGSGDSDSGSDSGGWGGDGGVDALDAEPVWAASLHDSIQHITVLPVAPTIFEPCWTHEQCGNAVPYIFVVEGDSATIEVASPEIFPGILASEFFRHIRREERV